MLPPVVFPFEATSIHFHLACAFSRKYYKFRRRPNSEPLLRFISNVLIQHYSCSPTVIDIGCWIGDNALPWARVLEASNGNILAIDPSSSNCQWVEDLKKHNKIHNLITECALCGESDLQKYSLSSGTISHGSFTADTSSTKKSTNVQLSRTIDDVVSRLDLQNISLIHVDVEGMELDVLKGALATIGAWSPDIIFECHISSEAQQLSKISELLLKHGYLTYQINEVLNGCNLDCRNFLAVHNSRAHVSTTINSSTLPQHLQNLITPCTSHDLKLLPLHTSSYSINAAI